MKTFALFLLTTFCSLLTTAPALAYPGEVEKPDDKVPAVETWKVSDVTPPTHNYSTLRLSRKGVALKKDDPREAVLESIFYEDPDHPGEFGAIFRAKNEKNEWVIFAKCWGMKKVDGQWEQDIDKDKNGRPDDNGHVNFAVLDCHGKWCAGIEGQTNFAWKTIWDDPDEKDHVEEISYCIGGKDPNDPSGLFLHAGHVTVTTPKPESTDEEDKPGAEK